MTIKTNEELSKADLNTRLSRLTAVKSHLMQGNGDSMYTVNHAVVKAIDRELEDVTKALKDSK